ncbi:MAG: methylmalonyl Co-A mutase-associated GTPase MeaB, partial [Muribaculaceae bacterium]|nr:methylmalonyl Co-A mutase-associated GTPase MeaB [Muribaculaceae bacterium]
HLFPPTASGWRPEVLTYSGYYELGIAEVWEMIDRYFDFVKANGFFDEKRRRQARWWMYETIDEQLRKHFYDNPTVQDMLAGCEADVLANRRSSFAAAAEVLDKYFSLKQQ